MTPAWMPVIASITADRKPNPSQSKVGRVQRTNTRSEIAARLAACLILGVIVVPSASAGAPESETDSADRNAIESSVDAPEATEDSGEPRIPGFADPTRAATQPSNPQPHLRPREHRRNVVLDPSARLVRGSGASEYWTLYIELDSGHRIAQQFLLSNAGPGDHNAVAVGHLVEVGREPYRYTNGRRRARWRLSEDRLFLDIGSSHLDLHRPLGELRITKDEVEIHLFFAFGEKDVAESVPAEILPRDYRIDVLAVAAKTEGTIQAPWMTQPITTRGRTWLTHTWTKNEEAERLDRRVDVFGFENETSFYALQLQKDSDDQRSWILRTMTSSSVVESSINIQNQWTDEFAETSQNERSSYPVPSRFIFSRGPDSGQITLGRHWLHFDPLAVLPQPFRWFVRRKTKPHQVWADALIGVRLSQAPETPSLPDAGKTESVESSFNSKFTSKREIEKETAVRSVTGVASITFMNPTKRR